MKKIFLLLIFPWTVVCAQQFTTTQILGQINTITTAVPFLRICPDARAGGMGESTIALANDANATHWNISRLAFAKRRFGVSFSYTPWLRALVPDINHFYASVYFKPDSVSAIGISARYFSLGNITFTTPVGTPLGQFRPFEYALSAGYARQLFRGFSVGISGRYVYSDLTNGITIGGYSTHPGESYAGDLGISYETMERYVSNINWKLVTGLALTNVGTKLTYSDSTNENFIPINLGIAEGVVVNIGTHHHLEFQVQFEKLLVPSPPVYAIDPNTGSPMIVNGQYVILYGKDPNRTVWKGMTGSFNDAPGGTTEEMHEINFSYGLEYVYNQTFAVRTGYFYEHYTKGNRQFITFGAGIMYSKFTLDLAYLVPTNAQRSPLQNTLRFTLHCHLDFLNKSERMKRASENRTSM